MPFSHESIAAPTGSRRLTLTMLAARERADEFVGAVAGSARPLSYLAAFQEAEPYLGLPPHAYKLIAWLVKQTMPHDWEVGSRPICWPSAARQAEFLGLSPARVKVLNRALFEAGIVIVRDSETGKRYGRRGADGRIIEAYGFDLSPLAYRHDEFIRLAAEAKAERERMRALKKRATRARRGIRQLGETLAAVAPLPCEWTRLEAETAELVAAIRSAGRSEDLAWIVRSLESLENEAVALLKEASSASADPVSKSPAGLVSKPHNISTNISINPKDTVIAADGSSRGDASGQRAEHSDFGTEESCGSINFQPYERIEKLHPSELIDLAPRLASHIASRFPDWWDVVDAAGGALRHELGVSQSLWGEACETLGRPTAAIALAVVSTKPSEHFTCGAGGYFAAMVKRARTGELHLDRSLWALRRARWGSARRPAAGGF